MHIRQKGKEKQDLQKDHIRAFSVRA